MLLSMFGQRASHLRQKPIMTSQKRRFILKMAKAKNARAFGVRWSALFYVKLRTLLLLSYKYCAYSTCRDDSIIRDCYLVHKRKLLPHHLFGFAY